MITKHLLLVRQSTLERSYWNHVIAMQVSVSEKPGDELVNIESDHNRFMNHLVNSRKIMYVKNHFFVEQFCEWIQLEEICVIQKSIQSRY